MLLNRRSEYAILGMIHLAKRARDFGSGRYSDVGEVAAAAGVPVNLLRVLFYRLAKDGILRSQRGVGGGFALNEPADAITLRRIVESVQGPITPFSCVANDEDPNDCERYDTCELYTVLRRVRARIVDELERNTLASMIADSVHEACAPSEQSFVA